MAEEVIFEPLNGITRQNPLLTHSEVLQLIKWAETRPEYEITLERSTGGRWAVDISIPVAIAVKPAMPEIERVLKFAQGLAPQQREMKYGVQNDSEAPREITTSLPKGTCGPSCTCEI